MNLFNRMPAVVRTHPDRVVRIAPDRTTPALVFIANRIALPCLAAFAAGVIAASYFTKPAAIECPEPVIHYHAAPGEHVSQTGVVL